MRLVYNLLSFSFFLVWEPILWSLYLLARNFFFKNDCIATVKSWPIMCQVGLKNSDVNPFGPGDLLLGIAKRTVPTSSAITFWIRLCWSNAEQWNSNNSSNCSTDIPTKFHDLCDINSLKNRYASSLIPSLVFRFSLCLSHKTSKASFVFLGKFPIFSLCNSFSTGFMPFNFFESRNRAEVEWKN